MALILVIDDAATVRQLVGQILTGAKHSVIEAEDGDVGLVLFADKRPTLVITDLFMPNREGIETIQEIRRLHPGAKIIAMSASATGKFYLGAAKKLGADAVLEKPFEASHLLKLVDRLLAQG
jgi:two-component system, chemotaxis family, chemotaxis protein CheY